MQETVDLQVTSAETTTVQPVWVGKCWPPFDATAPAEPPRKIEGGEDFLHIYELKFVPTRVAVMELKHRYPEHVAVIDCWEKAFQTTLFPRNVFYLDIFTDHVNETEDVPSVERVERRIEVNREKASTALAAEDIHTYFSLMRAIDMLEHRLKFLKENSADQYELMLSEAYVVRDMAMLPKGMGGFYIDGRFCFQGEPGDLIPSAKSWVFHDQMKEIRKGAIRLTDDRSTATNRVLKDLLMPKALAFSLYEAAYILADMAKSGIVSALIRFNTGVNTLTFCEPARVMHDENQKKSFEIIDLKDVEGPEQVAELLMLKHGFVKENLNYVEITERPDRVISQRFVVFQNEIVEAFPPSRKLWNIREEDDVFSMVVDVTDNSSDETTVKTETNERAARRLLGFASEVVFTGAFNNTGLMVFDAGIIGDKIYITSKAEPGCDPQRQGFDIKNIGWYLSVRLKTLEDAIILRVFAHHDTLSDKTNWMIPEGAIRKFFRCMLFQEISKTILSPDYSFQVESAFQSLIAYLDLREERPTVDGEPGYVFEILHLPFHESKGISDD